MTNQKWKSLIHPNRSTVPTSPFSRRLVLGFSVLALIAMFFGLKWAFLAAFAVVGLGWLSRCVKCNHWYAGITSSRSCKHCGKMWRNRRHKEADRTTTGWRTLFGRREAVVVSRLTKAVLSQVHLPAAANQPAVSKSPPPPPLKEKQVATPQNRQPVTPPANVKANQAEQITLPKRKKSKLPVLLFGIPSFLLLYYFGSNLLSTNLNSNRGPHGETIKLGGDGIGTNWFFHYYLDKDGKKVLHGKSRVTFNGGIRESVYDSNILVRRTEFDKSNTVIAAYEHTSGTEYNLIECHHREDGIIKSYSAVVSIIKTENGEQRTFS